MDKKLKLVIGIAFLGLFIAIASVAYNSFKDKYTPQAETATPKKETEAVKKAAPDFQVYDASGNPVKLSDFIGKPVVLNFWASWCPPCQDEMPHFNKAYNDFKDDVIFMMVDLVDGQRETQDKGEKYINEKDFKFPVYYDNKQDASNKYRISSIPLTLIIDRDGNIVKRYSGSIDEKTLVNAINMIK